LIEDKDSAMTFSGLGQDAELENKQAWDPNEEKRKQIKSLLDKKLNGYEIRIAGTVTVGLEDGNGKVLFYVKDTGIGITDEDKKGLFTEGGRGKDSVKVNVDSTGYGLYTVKLITEAHKGKVWVESTPSKGSTFFVELPKA
jgi:signal transduction histidine kinase